EIKQSRSPVRGAENGSWERRDASGTWRPYGNGYRQALEGKNALRSAMSSIKPVGNFYPDAWVIFFGGLPAVVRAHDGRLQGRRNDPSRFFGQLPERREKGASMESG
ncbi:hypothetical protein, partial [Xanthobacter autotrophicus]|uniref:hypothetical protein n=1 Tax=Xanthobacter autotrophicus TaxID=280 RepID=UPI00372C544A